MNPIFASDLQRMTADFGQVATWGAFTTTGVLEIATEDLVSEDGFAIVRGETPAFSFPRADLPGLKRKDVLVIAGTSYRVKHLDLVADGLLATAYLELA